jgi:hypothetical protein
MVGEIPYESVPERTTKPNVKIKPRKGHASSRRGVGRISPRFAGALGRRQGQPVFVARHETARIANMLLKLMRGLTNCRSQHQRPAEAQSRSYIPLNSPGEHRAWRDEDVHVFENVGHSTPCSVAPTCHVCRAGCGDRDFMSGRITRTAQFAVFRAPRRRLRTGSRRWGPHEPARQDEWQRDRGACQGRYARAASPKSLARRHSQAGAERKRTANGKRSPMSSANKGQLVDQPMKSCHTKLTSC